MISAGDLTQSRICVLDFEGIGKTNMNKQVKCVHLFLAKAQVWDSLTKQNFKRNTSIKQKAYKMQTYATKGRDLSFQ